MRDGRAHGVNSSGRILLRLVGLCGLDGRSSALCSNTCFECFGGSRRTPVEVEDFGPPDVGVASEVGHDGEDEEGEGVEHD